MLYADTGSQKNLENGEREMSRGFKEITKKTKGKIQRAREATNHYLLKTSVIDDEKTNNAKERFREAPYGMKK